VSACVDGCAGAVVERNRGGDMPASVIRARAAVRGLSVRMLTEAQKDFPRRTPGVIYVREVWSASSKSSRASGPAAMAAAKRVHMVGHHPALELEMTTYEPGSGPSPNRLDAVVFGVLELGGLSRDVPGRPAAGALAGAHTALRDRIRATARTRRIG
jgi:phage terminase large subunit-like protein